MRIPRMVLICGALASAAFSTGCATFDVPWFDRAPEASARNPVVKIMCLWEPSEGRDPDGMPCRGFAGQVLFLGNKEGRPVKVHGDLTVHVFDDQGTLEEQSQPFHAFKFNDLAWSRHLRDGTSVGAAYHVFIPYMRPGIHEANCAIRITLTPPHGAPVYSDLGNIKLAGKSRQPVGDATADLPEATGKVEIRRGPETTTIPLDDLRKKSPELDSARTNRLLEDFLRKQSQKQDAEEPPPLTSIQRIRFDGQRTRVVPRDPPTQTADTENVLASEGT